MHGDLAFVGGDYHRSPAGLARPKPLVLRTMQAGVRVRNVGAVDRHWFFRRLSYNTQHGFRGNHWSAFTRPCRQPRNFHLLPRGHAVRSAVGRGERRITKSWDNMTYHDKLEILRREMTRLHAALHAVTCDLDETWDAMRETRSEVDKITKDVATLRSLWPRRYSRAG